VHVSQQLEQPDVMPNRTGDCSGPRDQSDVESVRTMDSLKSFVLDVVPDRKVHSSQQLDQPDVAPDWTGEPFKPPDPLDMGPVRTMESLKSLVQVDVSALLGQALAEQQPSEDFDAVLQRLVGEKCHENGDLMYRLLSHNLEQIQQMRHITREEAAKEFAGSHPQLQLGKLGKQTFFQSEIRKLVGGLVILIVLIAGIWTLVVASLCRR
jgi:hypothetical protein